MNVDELVVRTNDGSPATSSSAATTNVMAPPSQKPRARQRAQLSCDRCRRLKRKCDRVAPCSECRSIGTDCTFERAQQTSTALADSRERRKAARRRSAWPESAPIKFNTDEVRSPNDVGTSSSSASSSRNGSMSSGFQNGTPSVAGLYPTVASTSSGSLHGMHTSPFNNSDSSPASGGGGGDNNGYMSSSSAATTWTSPDVITAAASPSSTSLSEIENLVRESAFFERIMATWYRELEWASDAIRNSPFDRVMVKDRQSIQSQAQMDRFKGLLFGIVAMCSLIVPTDVESILVCMSSARQRHGFYSAEAVGQAAHAAAGKWLDDKARRSSVEGWGVEAFQASLVHGMYIKYSGNWNVYREHSSRDMDRLHRAGYHRLAEMVQNNMLNDDEIAARYAVFWRYFSFDRIASLFDGIPYTIQARNADTWLFTANENVHIRTLCRDSGAGDPLNGLMAQTCPLKPSLITTLRKVITPYSLMMIQLAALAGRCSDRLNSMTQASLSDNYIRAEHIAAETDDELQLLEQGINMDDFDEFQRPMITMTITRIRRDVTTRLSRHIAKQHRAAPNGEEALVQTLNRRCLNTAKSLIRRVTGVAGPTPVRAIATPFFTLFVAETMMELLTEVEEAAKSSSPPGLLDFEAQDDLKHALIARNFLALLARLSEIALNKMIAYKACLQVQTVLQQCVPAKDAHTYQHVMEITRIFDPDVVIATISAPRQQLEEDAPQRAEDVLNLLGSLTSLQRIFEMGGQTWSN